MFVQSVRRMGGLAAVATLATAIAAAVAISPTAAMAAPATPYFSSTIDSYAGYDGQEICDPSAKPGVVGFKDLLNSTYGSHTWGIVRDCSSGGTSEHKEGRALDYHFNYYDAAQRADAADLRDWLLATDSYGNKHAMARRLGIMYMIWNNEIWKSYEASAGWQPYSGSSPHTDHIHFSFSWDGAKKRTSWWSGGDVLPEPEDVPISGDWDADGDETVGVFRPSNSTFYLRNTNSGVATSVFKFGHGPSGDIPVVGDWNNDGKDTVGVFRPSNSTWYLTNGTTSTDMEFIFGHGASGDRPVAGDWNNDGTDTVGVFRPDVSTWYLTNGTTSTDMEFKFGHGPSGDQAVAGDWNNDGKDTVGVFRPSNSTWYLTNATGTTDVSFIFGHGPSGDVAVPGDWDNDGDATPGVRRPSNNTVYLRNTNSGGPVDMEFIYGI
ncbi:VCBS repeat-containing protein [Micromonospora phytophila]|uniref:FG-GAP repeat domain-containing protein n=1 Tax=Micromonospora phytophila TaxID=709888 RepID=UPI0020305E34|nr:VCBS repeat-containing protein [Micromonospora phytophila]MCM0675800.1 VCBS repeat-containing protein [Micromonospora phytophila]